MKRWALGVVLALGSTAGTLVGPASIPAHAATIQVPMTASPNPSVVGGLITFHINFGGYCAWGITQGYWPQFHFVARQKATSSSYRTIDLGTRGVYMVAPYDTVYFSTSVLPAGIWLVSAETIPGSPTAAPSFCFEGPNTVSDYLVTNEIAVTVKPKPVQPAPVVQTSPKPRPTPDPTPTPSPSPSPATAQPTPPATNLPSPAPVLASAHPPSKPSMPVGMIVALILVAAAGVGLTLNRRRRL